MIIIFKNNRLDIPLSSGMAADCKSKFNCGPYCKYCIDLSELDDIYFKRKVIFNYVLA